MVILKNCNLFNLCGSRENNSKLSSLYLTEIKLCHFHSAASRTPPFFAIIILSAEREKPLSAQSFLGPLAVAFPSLYPGSPKRRCSIVYREMFFASQKEQFWKKRVFFFTRWTELLYLLNVKIIEIQIFTKCLNVITISLKSLSS